MTSAEQAIERERAGSRLYYRVYREQNREKINARQRERYRNNVNGYRDKQLINARAQSARRKLAKQEGGQTNDGALSKANAATRDA